MAARDVLHSFPEALLRDELILSVPERELLASLLQRARTQPGVSSNGFTETFARVLGEVIAERACGVLGDRIANCLLDSSPPQLGIPDRTRFLFVPVRPLPIPRHPVQDQFARRVHNHPVPAPRASPADMLAHSGKRLPSPFWSGRTFCLPNV